LNILTIGYIAYRLW